MSILQFLMLSDFTTAMKEECSFSNPKLHFESLSTYKRSKSNKPEVTKLRKNKANKQYFPEIPEEIPQT